MMKHKKRKAVWKILILVLVLCGLILMDSRLRLVVSEYEIGSLRLPGDFEGYRIVQLSDLHGMEFGEGNARLLEKVRKAEPDIIALTGDLADRDTDMALVDALLGGLVQIAPTYYVSGNHEWSEGILEELSALFEKHGVNYLRNEYVSLTRGDSHVILAGVEDPNGWRDMTQPEQLVDIISKEQGEEYRILLGHRNYWVEEYPDLKVDIILCGHAHGGIVRLPFLGGVFGTGFTLFPEHVDGLVQGGRYQMLVSRGLGSSVAIPRFLNNPEIVVLTLHSET